MNAFDTYGSQITPTRLSPRKASKAPSKLDLKMEEKQRLSRRYRKWKREQAQTTLREEPRLVGFLRYLRTINAVNGGELIEAIAESWLPDAPQNVRLFALRMISARCDRINRQLGNEALDDPMPPHSSIYFQARDALHEGGRL